jgi:hypothetical protein
LYSFPALRPNAEFRESRTQSVPGRQRLLTTFEQIGHQLNAERSTAYKAWERALKRLPKANVEALRKAGRRLQRLRGKALTEIAGRADPAIRPK